MVTILYAADARYIFLLLLLYAFTKNETHAPLIGYFKRISSTSFQSATGNGLFSLLLLLSMVAAILIGPPTASILSKISAE